MLEIGVVGPLFTIDGGSLVGPTHARDLLRVLIYLVSIRLKILFVHIEPTLIVSITHKRKVWLLIDLLRLLMVKRIFLVILNVFFECLCLHEVEAFWV